VFLGLQILTLCQNKNDMDSIGIHFDEFVKSKNVLNALGYYKRSPYYNLLHLHLIYLNLNSNILLY